MDDEDDRNMEVGFSKIQAEERRSAKIAREEDEREQELIEAEERAERARKAKKRKLR
jgi:protein SPT2